MASQEAIHARPSDELKERGMFLWSLQFSFVPSPISGDINGLQSNNSIPVLSRSVRRQTGMQGNPARSP